MFVSRKEKPSGVKITSCVRSDSEKSYREKSRSINPCSRLFVGISTPSCRAADEGRAAPVVWGTERVVAHCHRWCLWRVPHGPAGTDSSLLFPGTWSCEQIASTGSGHTYSVFYSKLLRPLLSFHPVLGYLCLLTLKDVLGAPFLCDGAKKSSSRYLPLGERNIPPLPPHSHWT